MPAIKQDDPYGAFNFLVEIDGVAAAGFSECAGLSAETDVIEYREGGDVAVRKLIGLTRYSCITLKRGLTGDMSLWHWRRNIIAGTNDRRNGAIVLLNSDRQEVARWVFRRGWPSKWEGPIFRAKTNDVAIETLEITHEGIEWG